MNIPKYARYDYCAKKACEFLEQYNIKSFPINPFEVIQAEKYGLMKYSDFMEEYHCSLDKVCTCLRSADGKTIFDGQYYSIAYNDFKVDTRIRFTLMHELGHIFLNHLIDFEKTEIMRDGKITSGLTRQEYKVLENEANAFARNVLSPVSMFLTLKDKSINNVSFTFGISPSAAETRIDFINRDTEIIKSLNLLQRFMLVYHRFMNKRKCTICNTQFFYKYKYCPICGAKNTLEWGDGKMRYPLPETHENGKLIECPNCGNEDTSLKGDYCQICGENLVNKCINEECENTEILPSNARYCPICGAQSQFYQNNLIKAWTYYNSNNTYEAFMDIPDGPDEELPFN